MRLNKKKRFCGRLATSRKRIPALPENSPRGDFRVRPKPAGLRPTDVHGWGIQENSEFLKKKSKEKSSYLHKHCLNRLKSDTAAWVEQCGLRGALEVPGKEPAAPSTWGPAEPAGLEHLHVFLTITLPAVLLHQLWPGTRASKTRFQTLFNIISLHHCGKHGVCS